MKIKIEILTLSLDKNTRMENSLSKTPCNEARSFLIPLQQMEKSTVQHVVNNTHVAREKMRICVWESLFSSSLW